MKIKKIFIKNFKGILSNDLGKFIFSKQSRKYKWNKQYSKYLISKGNYDILHPTYYHPYFLKNLKTPYVITVHDMIHELMPEYFSQNDPVPYHKRLCIEKASHIIAISETTKEDLINILDIHENRISVIHHGYKKPNIDSNQLKVDIKGNYILYVGDRAGYKNFTNFITALSPLLLERHDLSLICAGGGEFQITENELIMRLKLKGKVKQISATEQQLNSLYSNAIIFVFPSLYEGFGLPILEAFQNNCPIVASDNACFREILGNAGHYFDPNSHSEMLSKITNLIDNPSIREGLIKKGKEQLPKFAFEKCINKTIEVYHKISSI